MYTKELPNDSCSGESPVHRSAQTQTHCTSAVATSQLRQARLQTLLPGIVGLCYAGTPRPQRRPVEEFAADRHRATHPGHLSLARLSTRGCRLPDGEQQETIHSNSSALGIAVSCVPHESTRKSLLIITVQSTAHGGEPVARIREHPPCALHVPVTAQATDLHTLLP
jgi:hypothetical protein